jgi:hypothetical protein
MKLEKLNKKQIALANDKMNLILGGRPSLGDTRFHYTAGTEVDFNSGVASSDRMVDVYTFDVSTNSNGWVCTGNGTTNFDPPATT